MDVGRDWWKRLRRALFQIHLWIGLGAGIFVLFTSITGSIVTLPDLIIGDKRKWLESLHIFILDPKIGYPINAVGALLFTALGVTGAVIWWPGIRNWRNSIVPGREKTWNRFSWRLHSAVGVWSVLFIFMWGITGFFLSLRQPTAAIVDSLAGPGVGDTFLKVLAAFHRGNFGVLSTRPLWGVLGILPPLLLLTGVVMWWTRTRRGKRGSGML
jgi:uncharacterized iron-regulated membrane protein